MRRWHTLVTQAGPELVPACCRCGACCLAELCPAARMLDNWSMTERVPGPCPHLTFDTQGTALCGLHFEPAVNASFGTGCCIKARVVTHAGQGGLAQLSDTTKRMLAAHMRRQAQGVQA